MTLEAGREAINIVHDELPETANDAVTVDELEARNRWIDEELGLLKRSNPDAVREALLEEVADDAARAYNTSAPVLREIITIRAQKRMTPEEARRRANEAVRVLNEPLFKEAMLLVERGLYDELLNADPTEAGDELRRSLVDRIRAVREVLAALANMVDQVREPSRPGFA